MKPGDRVKYSQSALQTDRDYWLSQGQPQRRSEAEQHYLRKKAKRGVITELVLSCKSAAVTWDDGTQSKCLSYLLEGANP